MKHYFHWLPITDIWSLKERATKLCVDFLTEFNASANSIETKYQFANDYSVGYTCATDDISFNGSSQSPPVSRKSCKYDLNLKNRRIFIKTSVTEFQTLIFTTWNPSMISYQTPLWQLAQRNALSAKCICAKHFRS